MRIRKGIFIPLLLFTSAICIAQDRDDVFLATKSAAAPSAFDYYDRAEKCSRQHDSINASNNFLKVNPYWLMYNNIKPLTIDSLFNNFSLTKQAKAKYRQLFKDTFYKKRTTAYTDFKRMYGEDTAIRNEPDNTTDNISHNKLLRRRRSIDSAHFAYLDRYLKKYGWPDMAHGSLYAQLIALHNHAEHTYYLPSFSRRSWPGNCL